MRCTSCGAKIKKNQTHCPVCGQDHTIEHNLTKVRIPNELKHLSIPKIADQVRRQKRWARVLMVVFVVLLFVLTGYQVVHLFKRPEFKPTTLYNYHDDLITMNRTNNAGNTSANLIGGGYMVATGDNIYISDYDGIYVLDLALSTRKQVTELEGYALNRMNDALYYINDDHHICRYDLTEKKATIYNDSNVLTMAVLGDYLVYIEGNHQNLCISDLELTTTKVISQGGVQQFAIYFNNIYFTTSQGLYIVPMYGGDVTQLSQIYMSNFVLCRDDFFYICEGDLYRCDLNSIDNANLLDENVSCITARQNYIYYGKQSGGLFEYNVDNGKLNQLNSEEVVAMQTSTAYLFYTHEEKGEVYYLTLNHENQNGQLLH